MLWFDAFKRSRLLAGKYVLCELFVYFENPTRKIRLLRLGFDLIHSLFVLANRKLAVDRVFLLEDAAFVYDFVGSRAIDESSYLEIRQFDNVFSASGIDLGAQPFSGVGVCTIQTHANHNLQVAVHLHILVFEQHCTDRRMMAYLLEIDLKVPETALVSLA